MLLSLKTFYFLTHIVKAQENHAQSTTYGKYAYDFTE
jgi:hypothetical protein